jgi:Protein of unknown function (DUF2975)
MASQKSHMQVRLICQIVRVLAVTYALWSLWLTVSFWTRSDLVFKRFKWLTDSQDFTVTPVIQGFGLALNLGIWILLAVACFEVWRLFSAYLAGNIFSKESTSRFLKISVLGLATMGLDLLCRPLFSLLVTSALPPLSRINFYFNPHDLMLILLLLGLYALGHIFRAASEMAEDQAHIL